MTDFFEETSGTAAGGWGYFVGTRRDVSTGGVMVYLKVLPPGAKEFIVISEGLHAASDAAGLLLGAALANAWAVSAVTSPAWRRLIDSAKLGGEYFSFLVAYSPDAFVAYVFDRFGAQRGNPKLNIHGAPRPWPDAESQALTWAQGCVADGVGVG